MNWRIAHLLLVLLSGFMAIAFALWSMNSEGWYPALNLSVSTLWIWVGHLNYQAYKELPRLLTRRNDE